MPAYVTKVSQFGDVRTLLARRNYRSDRNVWRRRLLILACAFTLALWAASAAAWVGSYHWIRSIYYTVLTSQPGSVRLRNWDMFDVSLQWGSIDFGATVTRNDDAAPSMQTGIRFRRMAIRANWQKPPIGVGNTFWNRFGFSLWHGNGIRTINGRSINGFTQRTTQATVPLWLPALLSLVFSAIGLFVLSVRRKKGFAGLCVTCGYDLRASPDRCPECGALGTHGVPGSVTPVPH